jgi:dephospho-CoA kinase
MIVFGLTGNIACGKSTVSRTLIENNIPVVDADVVARQVVEPGQIGLEEMVIEFGVNCLAKDGTLDRAKVAELVFNHPDPNERAAWLYRLNRIMVPRIQEESARQIHKLQEQGQQLICYDAALLIEAGNADKFRPLIVVHCPTSMQVERLIKRNGLTEEQAMNRIATQLPSKHKVEQADFVIDTSGTLEQSKEQTLEIIKKLRHMLPCEGCRLSEVMGVLVTNRHTCR